MALLGLYDYLAAAQSACYALSVFLLLSHVCISSPGVENPCLIHLKYNIPIVPFPLRTYTHLTTRRVRVIISKIVLLP